MTDEAAGGATATEFLHIVAAVLKLDPAELDDGAGPATVGNWTSRKHIELVVTLEEIYGVSFATDEILGIRSVCDLRDTLRGKGALS
ncbi:MAG: acyl carrier protein [Micromonosporaceae bacterium]